MTDSLVLSVKNLVKRFPGTIALKGVDFDLYVREIHALVGQNGAGKSTLVKVLNGVYRPDEGSIAINGREVSIKNPSDARRYGLTLIHQEVMVIPNLSIAENIFISRFRLRERLRYSDIIERAKEYLEIVGLNKDPRTKVRELRVVEQQLVQFARALAEEAQIICVDELTSALNPLEAKHVFSVMEEFKKKGKSFIFITHRIEEVFEVSDRVSVLREGVKVLTERTASITPSEIVKAMIGRSLEEVYVSREKKFLSREETQPILRIINLSTTPLSPAETPLKNISFDLYEGEILGVVGLLGAGKTELGKALVGLKKISSGKILLRGREIRVKSPVDALRHGIVYLPEDRGREGIIPTLSLSDNIMISPSALARLSLGRFVRRFGLEKMIARRWVENLRIVAPSIDFKADHLSGGNKQKVLIARALETQAKILVFDEPTFGVDIGAKAEIRRIIGRLSDMGLSIILLTSDIDEALSLSDRIIVLSDGRVIATLDNSRELKRDTIISMLR